MSTNEQPTYRIPEQNWYGFCEDIAKLAKRARKLDVPEPVVTVVAEETVAVMVPDLSYAIDGAMRDSGRVQIVRTVTVVGEAPKYDGWSMIAVIDRDREELADNPDAPHTVNTIGETVADPSWRTAPDYCGHCNRSGQGRKLLVVVEHENGERKVVGSTCLRDFLGHASPASIASWAEVLATLDERCSDAEDDSWGDGAKAELRVQPVFFLACAVRCITVCGWMARSACIDGETSTADLAWNLTDDRWVQKALDGKRPNYELLAAITDDEKTEAAKVLAWVESLEYGDNDYLNNLVTIGGKASWRRKDVGFAASMVTAYRREVEKELVAAARAEASTSVHVGNVKDRIVVTGLVTFTLERDSDYGTTTLVKVLGDDGNEYTWWASGAAPEQGDRVTGKATVKKHDEFKGVLSTVVTRFAWSLVEAVAA